MAIPTVGAIIMTMTQTMTHTMSTTQYDYDHEESNLPQGVGQNTMAW